MKALFIELFGNTPILRVLDFLVVNNDFDYSMTEIAELSGVGYSTLKLFWPKLVAGAIVRHVRTIGKAEMHKLNAANPAVKKLKELYWIVTKRAVREAIKEETILEN